MAWLIIYAMRSVSKAAAFFSSVSMGWASKWLLLEFKSGCAASLFKRRGMNKSLIFVFTLGDAGMPVVYVEFMDEPFIIPLGSACRDNASRGNTEYA